MTVELRKALMQRRSSMHTEWAEWEPHFRELRQWIMPRRGRFDRSSNNDRHKHRRNKEIIDATARDGLRTLETGMHSGLTSPARRFFKLGTLDKAANEEPKNRRWLAMVEDRMYEVFRASNLYRMFPLAYRDLGLYGHHHSLILPDFENVIHAHTFAVGEYYLADDDKGRVNTSHRWMNMSTAKIVRRWGIENVPDVVRFDYEQNRHEAPHLVHCVIEPRPERDPTSPLSRNMRIAVYYWVDNAPDGEMLEIGGHEINRIVGPRWDVEPGDTYSHSPAMDALGDAGSLQQQHIDKAVAVQKSYNPPLQGHATHKKHRAKNFPGGITFMDTADLNKGGLRPLYEVKPDIQGLMLDINETQERVRSAFFVDLFQMFSTLDRRQITAEEIVRRHEEKVVMLGPTLERLDNELLGPVIEIVFHDMVKAELIPPAPEELAGQGLQIEYISMLHQAQKAAGIQSLERTIGFVGTLGQLKPDAVDKIDADAMVDEFAAQTGVTPRVIIETSKLEDKRAERAQQEAMAAEAEMMPALAQGADLLSEANARGNAAPGGIPL